MGSYCRAYLSGLAKVNVKSLWLYSLPLRGEPAIANLRIRNLRNRQSAICNLQFPAPADVANPKAP
jgi:hypothetical protein